MQEADLYKAEVIEIIDESPVVKRFLLRFRYLDEYFFKSGQFTILTLPIESHFNTRSYSIASAPQKDSNIIELCVVQKPDGKGSNYLFSQVKKGDLLQASSPQGKFILPDELAPEIVMICTGTGVAPFRSMIYDLVYSKNYRGKIKLIFGNRLEADILYKKEWEALEKQYPNFEFIPVLSRTPDWKFSGYVHEYYKNYLREISNTQFFICGWTAMVRDAKNNLKAAGYHKKQIFFELYD